MKTTSPSLWICVYTKFDWCAPDWHRALLLEYTWRLFDARCVISCYRLSCTIKSYSYFYSMYKIQVTIYYPPKSYQYQFRCSPQHRHSMAKSLCEHLQWYLGGYHMRCCIFVRQSRCRLERGPHTPQAPGSNLKFSFSKLDHDLALQKIRVWWYQAHRGKEPFVGRRVTQKLGRYAPK